MRRHLLAEAAINRRIILGCALAAVGFLLATTVDIGFVARDQTFLLFSGSGVVAVGMLALTLARPELAAAALLFILFTRVSDLPVLDPAPVSVSQMAVGLALVAMLVRRLALRREGLVGDRVLGLMLVYGAAIGLSGIAALDRVATLAALVAYLREAVIVFVLVNLVTAVAGLRVASWTLAGAGAFLAAAGVLHAYTGYDFGGLSSISMYFESGRSVTRLEGPVGVDSNHFAQLLVTVTPLALYRGWYERRLILRLLAFGAVSLLTLGIIGTFSRGGLLALFVVLGIAVGMQRFRPAKVIALGLALAPAALAAPQPYWDRMGATAQSVAVVVRGGMYHSESRVVAPSGSTTGPATSGGAGTSTPVGEAPSRPFIDQSMNDRPGLFRVGAQMFLDHPLTGVGRGNYYSTYPEYSERVDPALPAGAMGPHNTPVQIAAETGLVGLAAFVAVVVTTVFGLRSAKQRFIHAGLTREAMLLEAVEIGIYGFLFSSIFLNDNIYQRYLWILIGLAVIGRRLAFRAVPGARPATTVVRTPAMADQAGLAPTHPVGAGPAVHGEIRP